MALDGNRTAVVKLQLESRWSFNRTLVKWVGKFIVSAAGSGTYYQGTGYDSLDSTNGDDVVVRANQPIKSASAMVVTITGTDQNDAALSASATIAAYAPEGQSYQVIPTDTTKKFKTITTVTTTNGILGDGFDVAVLPASANDVEIKFDQGGSPTLGTEVKPIYDKYDLDHNKRIRGDHTLTINSFYTNNLSGIPLIHNRDVVFRQDFHDDGGNAITEVRYYDMCRLSVKVETPAAEDGEVTANAEGTFGKALIFS